MLPNYLTTIYVSQKHEKKRFCGYEKDSFVADPQFKDFDNCDFSLKESSPAFALGFKQIRTDDVGITL